MTEPLAAIFEIIVINYERNIAVHLTVEARFTNFVQMHIDEFYSEPDFMIHQGV